MKFDLFEVNGFLKTNVPAAPGKGDWHGEMVFLLGLGCKNTIPNTVY